MTGSMVVADEAITNANTTNNNCSNNTNSVTNSPQLGGKPGKAKFSSRNLNAVYKAPAHRLGDGGVGTNSSGGAYSSGGSNRMLVLRPVRGALASTRANAVAAPTPINTPSLRKECESHHSDAHTTLLVTSATKQGWNKDECKDPVTSTSVSSSSSSLPSEAAVGHDTATKNVWSGGVVGSPAASLARPAARATPSVDALSPLLTARSGNTNASGRWGDDAVEEDILHQEELRERERQRAFPDLRDAMQHPDHHHHHHQQQQQQDQHSLQHEAPHLAHRSSSQDVRNFYGEPSRSYAMATARYSSSYGGGYSGAYEYGPSHHPHHHPGAYERGYGNRHHYPQDARYDMRGGYDRGHYAPASAPYESHHRQYDHRYEEEHHHAHRDYHDGYASRGYGRAAYDSSYSDRHDHFGQGEDRSDHGMVRRNVQSLDHRARDEGELHNSNQDEMDNGRAAQSQVKSKARADSAESAWSRHTPHTSLHSTNQSVWKMSDAEVQSATNGTNPSSFRTHRTPLSAAPVVDRVESPVPTGGANGSLRILKRNGPRMLFDPKSGTMVNVDEKEPLRNERAGTPDSSNDRRSTRRVSDTTQQRDTASPVSDGAPVVQRKSNAESKERHESEEKTPIVDDHGNGATPAALLTVPAIDGKDAHTGEDNRTQAVEKPRRELRSGERLPRKMPRNIDGGGGQRSVPRGRTKMTKVVIGYRKVEKTDASVGESPRSGNDADVGPEKQRPNREARMAKTSRTKLEGQRREQAEIERNITQDEKTPTKPSRQPRRSSGRIHTRQMTDTDREPSDEESSRKPKSSTFDRPSRKIAKSGERKSTLSHASTEGRRHRNERTSLQSDAVCQIDDEAQNVPQKGGDEETSGFSTVRSRRTKFLEKKRERTESTARRQERDAARSQRGELKRTAKGMVVAATTSRLTRRPLVVGFKAKVISYSPPSQAVATEITSDPTAMRSFIEVLRPQVQDAPTKASADVPLDEKADVTTEPVTGVSSSSGAGGKKPRTTRTTTVKRSPAIKKTNRRNRDGVEPAIQEDSESISRPERPHRSTQVGPHVKTERDLLEHTDAEGFRSDKLVLSHTPVPDPSEGSMCPRVPEVAGRVKGRGGLRKPSARRPEKDVNQPAGVPADSLESRSKQPERPKTGKRRETRTEPTLEATVPDLSQLESSAPQDTTQTHVAKRVSERKHSAKPRASKVVADKLEATTSTSRTPPRKPRKAANERAAVEPSSPQPALSEPQSMSTDSSTNGSTPSASPSTSSSPTKLSSARRTSKPRKSANVPSVTSKSVHGSKSDGSAPQKIYKKVYVVKSTPTASTSSAA